MKTYTQEELKTILEKHGKYLKCEAGGVSADLRSADLSSANLSSADLSSADLRSADLSSANLSSADLSSADLRYADLSYADLSSADLSSANLSSANLSSADLSSADLRSANLSSADLRYADLRSADLRYADLRDANLRYADLRDANLRDTCLARTITAYEWCKQNGCLMRNINFRTLVLGSRTKNQRYMNGNDYEIGRLYQSPYFSRDPVTNCHPGLYIAGGPEADIDGLERILVAFWLDEMIVVEKARVPRFRTVNDEKEFMALQAEDLDLQEAHDGQD